LPKTDKSNEIDDVAKYDALVAIGGDGTLHEILLVNKTRPDCDALLKKLKLGHVGAGTSNGLSASLAHASQVGQHRRTTVELL
jgi:diacylglycerol kinase family enzyme